MNRSSTESWALITPADLFQSIRRRIPSIILTTLLFTAIVVGVLIVWPNSYTSGGLMYVRLGRGAIAVDPTANPSSTVSMQESRTTEVVSIGEMIASREIAERTVDQIGVDEINQPRTWIDRAVQQAIGLLPDTTSDKSWGDLTVSETADQLEREDAIKKIQKALRIDVPNNGYTITIGAKSSDPILAQTIVQTVMNEYGDYYVEAHRSKGSLQFFESQMNAGRVIATNAQLALQSTKNEMGWMSTASSEQALRDRVISLHANLDEVNGQLAGAKSRHRELVTRLSQVEKWIPVEVTSGIGNPAADGMREQLYDLQLQQTEAIAKLKPNHPRYKMLKNKLASSSQIVADQDKDREQRVEAVNPVHQGLQSDHQSNQAAIASLESRQRSLKSALIDAQSDIKRLNRDSVELASLKWESQIAERNYLDLARRFDDSRITDELDSEKMSDVSIIQDASLNLRKASPPRSLLAIVGAMLGMCLGLLQAVLRDPPVHKNKARHGSSSNHDAGDPAGTANLSEHSAMGAEASDFATHVKASEHVTAEPLGNIPR